QERAPDAGVRRREQLGLDAADRGDPAVQRELAGDRGVGARGPAGEVRVQRERDREPGRRAVLADAGGGEGDVEVAAGAEAGRDAELVGLAAQHGDGDLDRLLEHLAELAGDDVLAGAVRQERALDRQQLAVGGGPAHAVRAARRQRLLRALAPAQRL